MAKDILHSIAETATGQLIKARDADKGCSYACPACKQPFVFRKGSQKRPHFAHKVLSPNCTPETALHYSFKTLLHNKLQKYLDQDLPLRIQWTCSNCQEIHTGNLLKKAIQVRLEHNLGTCQPDIALLDKNDCVVAIIEVVVTHAPEQTTLEYYKKNQIAVVLYSLKSDEDIERLDGEILEPNDVNLCTNPKCSECGEHMRKKQLLIIDATCWKCHAPMKVAALQSRSGYIRLSDFSESDIQLANQNGCFLKSQYSHVVEEKYVANTCRKCRKFIGDHYLFGDYVADLEYEREELDAGYYCHHCS
jgi:Competence protein CoiA-like family